MSAGGAVAAQEGSKLVQKLLEQKAAREKEKRDKRMKALDRQQESEVEQRRSQQNALSGLMSQIGRSIG